jgi:hypothetical protein
MFRSRTGAEALAAWLARRKKRTVVAVEEALLAGRFPRYAMYRLTAFLMARGWGIALHVVELTWLAHVFSAKAFVASLALQNATLVLDAWFFGALEGMRRRARELGAGSEATALTARWLTGALWVGVAVAIVPGGRALYAWAIDERTPSLFHAYALVCGLRLGADVVLRTYYSGIFAHHRVYRPLWTPLVPPTVTVGGTALLWGSLGGWAFPVALTASLVLSRALLFHFTRRAYRQRRIPAPHWRLVPRRPRLDGRLLRDAVLAGLANTTTRLGGVVLLAAVIPSLSSHTSGPFEDDVQEVEPFAFALHLASPLLFVAGQWGLVFYHDWKRLEGELADALARHLHWRLLVTAGVVALVTWASASALVLLYVPWDEVWPTLLALLPAMLGLSVWTALQLRGFARGEFGRQVASAAAMLLALWLALSSSVVGPVSWYLALGGAPWVAIVLHALLGLRGARGATGEVTLVATWVHALEQARGDVRVWEGRVAQRPAYVTERIAKVLGERGAAVRAGNRLMWFERAPFTARDQWLRLGGGAFVALADAGAATGEGHRGALEARERLGRPALPALATLESEHARLFPEGFVLRVGRRPPPRFEALEGVARQAIWRDGLRHQRGIRGRSAWFVTTFAPRGAAEVLFVSPRPITSEQAQAWRAKIAPFGWRILAQAAPERAPRRQERADSADQRRPPAGPVTDAEPRPDG